MIQSWGGQEEIKKYPQNQAHTTITWSWINFYPGKNHWSMVLSRSTQSGGSQAFSFWGLISIPRKGLHQSWRPHRTPTRKHPLSDSTTWSENCWGISLFLFLHLSLSMKWEIKIRFLTEKSDSGYLFTTLQIIKQTTETLLRNNHGAIFIRLLQTARKKLALLWKFRIIFTV